MTTETKTEPEPVVNKLREMVYPMRWPLWMYTKNCYWVRCHGIFPIKHYIEKGFTHWCDSEQKPTSNPNYDEALKEQQKWQKIKDDLNDKSLSSGSKSSPIALDKFGYEFLDRVTGAKGVLVKYGISINGTIQYQLQPRCAQPDSVPTSPFWVDSIHAIEVVEKEKRMGFFK